MSKTGQVWHGMYALRSTADRKSYHGLRGSASPVLTATGFVNGRWQFSTPHRINTPWPITKKFGTGDYVGGPYGFAKFGANPSMGLLGKWVKYNQIFFYLYLFFMNSPTGQTRRRIDGSNDADSRKDVPFGGFVDIAPHFGSKIPQKPQFWAWTCVFKPNEQNIESFILSKLLHRFQPNFAQR